LGDLKAIKRYNGVHREDMKIEIQNPEVKCVWRIREPHFEGKQRVSVSLQN